MTELDVAVKAARIAGEAIRAVYQRENLAVQQKAGDKGPLTEADLRSNELLIAAISAAFPEDGILSEETADTPERLGKRRCWIIDPLDGTREFTLGLPEFCVSIGFVVDEVAVAGVLYNPITDELVAGEVGAGTTLNGAPVRVSSHAALAGARLVVSRNETEKGGFSGYDGVSLVPMGSVAWKFALVAAGRAEATFTPKPRNEWDLCGGVACVVAAGGRATDGSGADYRFNQKDPLKIGVCGTNGALHAAVLGLMR
jgi:myo-inositol-1(or 4)-monophosphatase